MFSKRFVYLAYFPQALSHHCDYFDIDSDGIIWPLDTFQVCRAWGWSFFVALFFAGAIHFVQSYGTNPRVTPDPFWRIWKKNIRRNKHGSSTLSFEMSGAFESSRLHAFFVENDHDMKGGLSIWELWWGLKRRGLPLDLNGQVSSFFEWLFAYLLVWPEDGVLREDDARGVCDGTMFRTKAVGDLGNSGLFVKQVLSLLIVDLIILPAIAAGMCYFVLRAVDDAVVLWRYLCRTPQESTPEKSWRGYSDSGRESEDAHPSAAGLVGMLIVVCITRLAVW